MGQGHPTDGEPWLGDDGELVRRESGQRGWKLLRGGSWFNEPLDCRAANRGCSSPDLIRTNGGVQPFCPLPPGFLLGA